MARDLDLHNDGRVIEMVYVDWIKTDEDDPYDPQHWDASTNCWRTERRADQAQTTWITLRGRYTDQWYRRHRHGFDQRKPIWRRKDSGVPAEPIITAALNDALPVVHQDAQTR